MHRVVPKASKKETRAATTSRLGRVSLIRLLVPSDQIYFRPGQQLRIAAMAVHTSNSPTKLFVRSLLAPVAALAELHGHLNAPPLIPSHSVPASLLLADTLQFALDLMHWTEFFI